MSARWSIVSKSRVAAYRRAAILAVTLCAPGVVAGDALEPPFQEVRFDQRLGERLPLGLTFRDETGRDVSLASYFGRRPVLLSLAYYRCPMLCTLVLNGIASASGAVNLPLGRDYEIVTISFDPNDTPAAATAKKLGYLSQYEHLGEGKGWHFLTGDAEAIRRLADAVGFRYVHDAATDQYAHPSGVVVVTPDGTIAQYLLGIEPAPRDLRLALVQASAGRVGSLADRLLLLCYRYDPATGRYGAAAFALMRAGGVATLAALAIFVAVMLRRDARLARRTRDAA